MIPNLEEIAKQIYESKPDLRLGIRHHRYSFVEGFVNYRTSISIGRLENEFMYLAGKAARDEYDQSLNNKHNLPLDV